MQPMSEETGKALVLAMRDLTETLKRSQTQNISVSDGAYVARSVLGGPDAAIAENKRARTARRRPKG